MENSMKQKMAIGARALFALLLLFFASRAVGDTIEKELDRFNLFGDCRPMRLIIETLDQDATKIGLTKEALQAAVESRLRSAQLYRSDGLTPYLYVNVNVVGKAFSIGLEYNKKVYDHLSGLSNAATTWDMRSLGTHGENAGYILSSISQDMDQFLLKFLRVNEDACEKRFALPNSRKDE